MGCDARLAVGKIFQVKRPGLENYSGTDFHGRIFEECPRREGEELSRCLSNDMTMQDYKSLRVAVTIRAPLVNTHTDTDTNSFDLLYYSFLSFHFFVLCTLCE